MAQGKKKVEKIAGAGHQPLPVGNSGKGKTTSPSGKGGNWQKHSSVSTKRSKVASLLGGRDRVTLVSQYGTANPDSHYNKPVKVTSTSVQSERYGSGLHDTRPVRVDEYKRKGKITAHRNPTISYTKKQYSRKNK